MSFAITLPNLLGALLVGFTFGTGWALAQKVVGKVWS
jgi:hypothetical protein